MTRPSDESACSPSQMLQMLSSVLTVQALYVAAELGIADQLAAGPRSVPALASATGAHPEAPYRLLRLIAGAGVFREESDGRFALTPLARCLCSEEPGSVRDWALYLCSPELWEVVGGLRDTVRNSTASTGPTIRRCNVLTTPGPGTTTMIIDKTRARHLLTAAPAITRSVGRSTGPSTKPIRSVTGRAQGMVYSNGSPSGTPEINGYLSDVGPASPFLTRPGWRDRGR